MLVHVRRNVAPSEPWSDDYIAEHAYLVARGVRAMAIVGHVRADKDDMLTAASRLEIASVNVDAVPFVVVRRDGWADCGFAAAQWVVDLYEWSARSDAVPEAHAHRIRGLLLGYSADAIRAHDERSAGRRFTSASTGPASMSRSSRRRGRAGTRAP
jgi:hypothetical protein